VTADRAIRRLTAVVVLVVATFAAIVSYSHIYDLGRAHGQAGTAARLLPLSVDGLILATSLVLLHEARQVRPAPALARWMLALGVGATVAANVAHGLAFGPLGGHLGLASGVVHRLGRDGDRHGPPRPVRRTRERALSGRAHPGRTRGTAWVRARGPHPAGAPGACL
jgi:hypothetical protein